MRRSLILLAVVAVVLAAGGAKPRATSSARSATATARAAAGVRLVKVGSFNQPLYVTAPPGDGRRVFVVEQTGRIRVIRDGRTPPLRAPAPRGERRRVFVVEQTGRIRVIRDGRTLPTPFLDLRNQVSCCDERGLLSMAFAPDYATSRRFY